LRMIAFGELQIRSHHIEQGCPKPSSELGSRSLTMSSGRPKIFTTFAKNSKVC